MQIYLVIITTILVLTQIIRVTQNWMQLSHMKENDRKNEEIKRYWERFCEAIEKLEKENVNCKHFNKNFCYLYDESTDENFCNHECFSRLEG